MAKPRIARTPTKFEWETIGDRQAEMKRLIDTCDIVIAYGPAGTGKTLVSTFTGLSYLDAGKVAGIVVTRPLVEVDEKIGTLPGGLDAKVEPHLATIDEFLKDHPRYQQLTYRYDENSEEKPMARELETVPLGLMRGRTFNNRYVIMDEAQNSTKRQMEMFLTRLGKESKMVITGDPDQCDLKDTSLNGLTHAIKLFAGHARIATVKFGLEDVQRHDLVAEVITAYANDRIEHKAGAKK